MFCFQACQKDDESIDGNNQSSLQEESRLSVISLEEFSQENQTQRQLDKLSKIFDVTKHNENLGINERVTSNDGEITLLTDKIIKVVTDSSATYSFLLETPTNQTSAFENLILEVKHDTLINYYLFRYQEQETQNNEGFNYNITAQKLDNNLFNLSELLGENLRKMSVTVGNCTFELMEYCFNCGEECESCYWDVTSYECGGSSGGDDTGGDDGFSGGGSGSGPGGNDAGEDLGGGGGTGNSSTNTNNDNLITASPLGVNEPTYKDKIIECLGEGSLTQAQLAWFEANENSIILKHMDTYIKKSGCYVMQDIILNYINNNETQSFPDYADQELECYDVQELTTNAYFQQAYNNLTNYLDEDVEYGYEVSKTNGIISTSSIIQGHYSGVDLNHGGNIIGGMHAHPHEQLMFSGADIYKLFYYYKSVASNPNVSPHDVFTLLVTPNGTYMLKIRDYTLLNWFFNASPLGKNIFRRKQNLHHKIFNDIDNNSNGIDYERELLEVFKELKAKYNMPKVPLYFYKLNTDNNQFEKLFLDSNGQPDTAPCN